MKGVLGYMFEKKINSVVAVVVTYNRKELLVECLSAILAQTYKVEKIILIDNASTDGTKEYLDENGLLSNPIIQYKLMNKNLGGSGGFYEGIKYCRSEKCDWVWVMDDDTIPTKTCLEELINANKLVYDKKNNEKISFLASAIYGPENEFMNLPNIDVRPSENGYAYWYEMLEYGMVNICDATFVSILVNIEAINKCGLPCKEYFIWGDDSEYTRRLTTFYGKAYLVGKSIAIHKRFNARSLNIYEEKDVKRKKMYRYLYRNNTINMRYYHTGKQTISLVKSILRCIKNIFNKDKRTCSWIQLVGTLEGITQYKKFANYIDGQLK